MKDGGISEFDLTVSGFDQGGHGFDCGGFSGPIVANNTNPLPIIDDEVDVLEHIDWSKGAVNSWLDNANQIVLQFQQSEEYLEAKKKYATSLSSFQATYKKLVETYQENNHIPTQAEFDDLSNSVYQLKKELRMLKKEMKNLRGAKDE